MNEEVLEFSNQDKAKDSDEDDFSKSKEKVSGKKSGGFQGMGLSYPVLKGILKRGYKIPTPIQRKTIPLVLEGRDVVAMARTGSGKTACFLIPMFEKLKTRQAKSGSRALILSPTRELALQTLKFIKEIGRFTGLQSAVILGGDSMNNQFSIIHGNPDFIVATPGRFLHICVEMDLNLKSIEYVVFDEADRLFEMGFGEQIHKITNRLPDTKQTLLFSATLPKVLVEFAKAGLGDPVLLRLDVESKLPDDLKLTFITCRLEEKLAVLLCLLKNVIKPDSQTVIFAATMHHVEYLHLILDKANISNTFIYSNLDPSARKINAAKFQTGKVQVLIVTDVAARGIDIPHLDNVINFNFPGKSKLFVHRVGRCARAGRSGTAYNIVAPDEYAYLLDLHLFLGRSFNIVPNSSTEDIPKDAIGKLTQSMIEEELSELITWHESITDIMNMQQVCNNAYQQYVRSRPAASTDSNKRVKDLNITVAGILPEFRDSNSAVVDLMSRMKSYRPRGTIFEIVAKPSSVDYKVMKEKRAFHKENIINFHRKGEYPNRPIPSYYIIRNTIQQFETTGCVNCQHKIRQPRIEIPDEIKVLICAAVELEPHLSSRKIARELEITKKTVLKVLRKYGYRPYKMHLHQELCPGDEGRRMEYCARMIDILNEDMRRLQYTCFSDECVFHVISPPNRQNYRHWATVNPKELCQVHTQYPQKVHTWVGLVGFHIIGPVFIEDNLNGEMYLEMLQQIVTPTLKAIERQTGQPVWFQQDGAPPHNINLVTAHLNTHFPNRWMGRYGPIQWPARSPDLTPLDFFLWGYVKNEIYNGLRLSNVIELRNRIIEVLRSITPDMLEKVQSEFYDRLGYCSAAGGQHFEHLL